MSYIMPMRPFLSVYEMSGGARADADAQKAAAEAQQLKTSQSQMQLGMDLRNMDEQKTISNAMQDALKQVQVTQAPQASADEASTVTPVVGAKTPEQTAAPLDATKVEQTPVVQPQVEQTPVAAAQTAPQTAPQTAAPQTAAPQTMRAPEVEQTPAPQVEQTPAETATPEKKLEVVRATPVVQGMPNLLSDDVFNTRTKIVQDLAANGKIRPQTADAYITNMTAVRDKRLSDFVAMQSKIAEVAEKQISTKEKQIQIAAKARDIVDNASNEVYQALKSGDLASARQIAGEHQLPINFDDPKDISQLEARAKRSSDFKAAQEEGRKAAKDEREATELKPVPGVAGAFYNPKGKIVDADGKTLSQREVNALDLQGKRAGATTVSVNNSPVTGEAIPKGAVPLKGIKADDQIKAGENLESSRVVIENAQRLKQLYPQVVAASGIDPKDSQFKAKFKSWVASNWDNNPIAREYSSRQSQMVNANLRLNKGAQTEGDAQREREALVGADMPPAAHNALIDSIIKRSTRQAKNNQNVQRGYIMPGSDEDNQPTESSGFESFAVPGTGKAPKTQTAAPKLGALPKVKSKGEGYDAIPPGSQYIGPDGKMYVKGNK